jgi:hypothetical protein
MPVDRRYRGISLQRELVDKIEEYIKNHPETGYKSLADFVTDAVRKRCEELKILVPISPELPELEHFNVYEDHVTIIDRKMRRIPSVFFRNNTIFCDVCEKKNCRHVKYALKLPKVRKALEKKGLKITPDGRIEEIAVFR